MTDNIEAGKEPIDPKTSWETSFTNPLEHDDNRFIYLVHGILGQEARGRQKEGLKELGIPYDPTQDIDLLTDPYRVSDRRLLLSSVIDQDHKLTWGNRGLILKVPYENVVFAHTGNVGGKIILDIDEALRNREPIPSVQEILRRTSANIYNEIALQGETDAGKIEPVGVFAMVKQDGEMVDPLGYQEISITGGKNDLPFVEIPR